MTWALQSRKVAPLAREDGEAGQAPVLDRGKSSGAQSRQTQRQEGRAEAVGRGRPGPSLAVCLVQSFFLTEPDSSSVKPVSQHPTLKVIFPNGTGVSGACPVPVTA